MKSENLRNKLRLSVVIPVYNLEGYVERCIRSIENQDISSDSYEIICVNDGSTDKSPDIIKTLQKEFDNIVLINQNNQGVSMARNNGINKARGKYLMFVDADDYIVENSLSKILQSAEKFNSQVLFFGYTVILEDGKEIRCLHNRELWGRTFPGFEAYFLSRSKEQTDPDSSWRMLYKTDFINNNLLHFLPDVPYLEDGEFMARVLCLAERCVFENEYVYQRVVRPGSATQSDLFHSEKAINGFLLAAVNLKKFRDEQSLSKQQRNFLNQPICKFVILAITSVQKPLKIKKLNKVINQLKDSGLKRLSLTSVKREYWTLGFLYNISVYLLVFYQIINNILKSLMLRVKR